MCRDLCWHWRNAAPSPVRSSPRAHRYGPRALCLRVASVSRPGRAHLGCPALSRRPAGHRRTGSSGAPLQSDRRRSGSAAGAALSAPAWRGNGSPRARTGSGASPEGARAAARETGQAHAAPAPPAPCRYRPRAALLSLSLLPFCPACSHLLTSAASLPPCPLRGGPSRTPARFPSSFWAAQRLAAF